MRKLYDAADRFCARHPRFGVPDLMRYIVIGNVVVFFLIMLTRGTNANALNFLYFDPQMVLRGEVWRIVTYIFVPSTTSVFWLVVELYFYYWIGSTLEREWGTAKFTLYYLCGMVLSILSTIILSLATGYYGWSLSDAYYINLTLFLAFAALYPDAQIMFYMIIPLKAKWLAWAGVCVGRGSVAALRYVCQCAGRCGGAFEFRHFLLGGHQPWTGRPEPAALPADHPIQVRCPATEADGGGAGLPPQMRGLRPHGRRPPGAGIPLLLQVRRRL